MSDARIVRQAIQLLPGLRITRVFSEWTDGTVTASDDRWQDGLYPDVPGYPYTPQHIPSDLRWVETAPILAAAAVANKP